MYNLMSTKFIKHMMPNLLNGLSNLNKEKLWSKAELQNSHTF